MSRHSIYRTALCVVATSSLALAQQGDRKGHVMDDPIPADKIPPSPYLKLEDALKSFKLADGFVIEPVADGEDVDMAVAVSFDANGRAWTCEMRSYMPNIDGKGEDTPNGRIRVLEDTDGDGKMDRATTFLKGLVLPRAVAVTSDGCLYTNGSALYFIKRNGLQPVGEPVVVDPQYAGGGNPEHQPNGLIYGHDNWYYSAKSTKRYRRINGKWVREETNFRGQWGIAKDNAGRLYHNNNSVMLTGDQFPPNFFRGHATHPPKAGMSHRIGSNRVHPIRITPGINRAYIKNMLDEEGKLKNVTAACGVTVYRGDNFPESAKDLAFICEPAGDLVKAVKITRDPWNKPSGSHPFDDKEFLASTDEWFLPCNLYTGPDGTLWVLDMYFGLLQHKAYMTTYLRKQYMMRGLHKTPPSTGRIYRVRYTKHKASPVPRMEGLTPGRLVEFLSHPNGLHRDNAQRLIVESGDTSIIPALTSLASDSSKPLGQIHALWTIDGLGKSSSDALLAALASKHSDVVNTALDIVSINRLTDPSIVKGISSLKSNNSTLHAHVRALAATGQSKAGISLVLENKKIRLIREAFVSGLAHDAAAFHRQHGKINDKDLEKLVVAASKSSSGAVSTPGKHLQGKDLASFQRGEKVYTTKAACIGCHGADGNGLPSLGPPLAQSEWVTGDPKRFAKILLHGMIGPVKVNGKVYKPAAPMPGLSGNPSISDQDLADVMNYVRNHWGNQAKMLSAKEVQKVRAATSNRAAPYQASELR